MLLSLCSFSFFVCVLLRSSPEYASYRWSGDVFLREPPLSPRVMHSNCSWLGHSSKTGFTLWTGRRLNGLQASFQVLVFFFFWKYRHTCKALGRWALCFIKAAVSLIQDCSSLLTYHHGFSLEETAASGKTCLQVPVCGLLPGADGWVYKEMVRCAAGRDWCLLAQTLCALNFGSLGSRFTFQRYTVFRSWAGSCWLSTSTVCVLLLLVLSLWVLITLFHSISEDHTWEHTWVP